MSVSLMFSLMVPGACLVAQMTHDAAVMAP